MPLVDFNVKVLGLLQPQVISVHQNDFIEGKLPNIGFLDRILLITYQYLAIASYPGSSTEKRGGSLEDFITCPVTYVRGFVRVLIIELAPTQSTFDLARENGLLVDRY